MKKIVIANWKMHGSYAHCQDYLATLPPYLNPHTDLIICPPFPYLSYLRNDLWSLGGQNCHTLAEGAFTGEVSASILHDVGCKYVLLGHSERRQHNYETDGGVAQKCTTAQSAGLIPIVCVGETTNDKANNLTQDIIIQQLTSLTGNFIIAYEPVWAIGTGATAMTADILPILTTIKQKFPHHLVLYGGSVKANNAAEILSLPIVDGVLVGGASLDPNELGKIIQSGAKLNAKT